MTAAAIGRTVEQDLSFTLEVRSLRFMMEVAPFSAYFRHGNRTAPPPKELDALLDGLSLPLWPATSTPNIPHSSLTPIENLFLIVL